MNSIVLSEFKTHIRYWLGKSIFFSILICITTITISYFVVSIVTSNIIESKNSLTDSLADSEFYSLYDNFLEIDDYLLSNNVDGLVSLKAFHYYLSTAEQFKYIECYSQSIKINYNPNEIKTLWIDKNYFEYCLPQVLSIRDEFINLSYQDNSQEVPIIMGHEFQKQFQIGDILTINDVFHECKAKVIGFLEEDTYLPYKGRQLNSSNMILYPMPQIEHSPTSEVNYKIQKIFYLFKTNGMILPNHTERDNIQSLIFSFCEKSNLPPLYYVGGATNQKGRKYLLSNSEMENIFLILSSIIGFTSFSSILLSIYYKVKENASYYAVLMLNGCTSSELSCIFLLVIIVQILPAYLIGSLPFYLFYRLNFIMVNPVPYTFWIMIIVCILGYGISKMSISKINIPYAIRCGACYD